MLRFIADAQARRTPLRFVLYWGKGLRTVLAAPEFACLDFLNTMMARVAEVHEPGVDVTLIFTDTHAALNGHSRPTIHSYFRDLELAASQHKFKTCLLSTLMNAPGLLPDELPEAELPPDDLLAELRHSAAKRFKGEGSAEEGAIRYFQANLLERKVVERAFPGCIFITFNNRRLRPLLPDMLPIYYMYSVRRGVSDKPWFLSEDCLGLTPRATQNSDELSHSPPP